MARDCPQTVSSTKTTATATMSSQEPYIDSHCHLEYVFQKLRLHADNKSLFAKLCQSEKFPANFAGCISVFWYAITCWQSQTRTNALAATQRHCRRVWACGSKLTTRPRDSTDIACRELLAEEKIWGGE